MNLAFSTTSFHYFLFLWVFMSDVGNISQGSFAVAQAQSGFCVT